MEGEYMHGTADDLMRRWKLLNDRQSHLLLITRNKLLLGDQTTVFGFEKLFLRDFFRHSAVIRLLGLQGGIQSNQKHNDETMWVLLKKNTVKIINS
jgi:hypothetical protein